MKFTQPETVLTLEQRLRWLQPVASGTLYCYPSDFNFVVVEKVDTSIQLSYPDHTLKTPYVQSTLDLGDPLHLTSLSTQVMLLGLLWQRNPASIYVGGFGAGRLPWLLHYWFPNAVIQCTDIEPKTTEVAALYFGVTFTENLRLTIQDSRQYLAAQAPDQKYDLMIIDVALGNGYTPYTFVTYEFFQLCQRHLSDRGVLVFNTLPGDRYLAYKIQTLQCVFPSIYACDTQDNKLIANRILFATHEPMQGQEALQRHAQQLDVELEATFSFAERARQLQQGATLLRAYFDAVPSAPLLRDGNPPARYFEAFPVLSPLRLPVRAGVPCPCGSGLAFIACHGSEFEEMDHR